MTPSGSRPRIESLSDLIFGLALSISALSLIGRPITSLPSVTQALLAYLFGFLILISVWFRYTRTMDFVRIETRLARGLNVALLFFVSVEPYLFNLLIAPVSPVSGVSDFDWWLFISSWYAVDLGSLFLILGMYDVAALRSGATSQPPENVLKLRAARNVHFIGAAFIFLSLVPALGSWRIPLGPELGTIPVRAILWFAPFPLIGGQRYLVRKVRPAPPRTAPARPEAGSSESEALPDEH